MARRPPPTPEDPEPAPVPEPFARESKHFTEVSVCRNTRCAEYTSVAVVVLWGALPDQGGVLGMAMLDWQMACMLMEAGA